MPEDAGGVVWSMRIQSFSIPGLFYVSRKSWLFIRLVSRIRPALTRAVT